MNSTLHEELAAETDILLEAEGEPMEENEGCSILMLFILSGPQLAVSMGWYQLLSQGSPWVQHLGHTYKRSFHLTLFKSHNCLAP
jgi:hypothetical protein